MSALTSCFFFFCLVYSSAFLSLFGGLTIRRNTFLSNISSPVFVTAHILNWTNRNRTPCGGLFIYIYILIQVWLVSGNNVAGVHRLSVDLSAVSVGAGRIHSSCFRSEAFNRFCFLERLALYVKHKDRRLCLCAQNNVIHH